MAEEDLSRQHEAVVQQGSGAIKTNWKHLLNFIDEYDQYRLKSEEMMNQFADM